MNDYELLAPGGITIAKIKALIERDPHLKSEHTRRGYLADLSDFMAWLNVRTMTKGEVEDYLVTLQAGNKAPNTINRKLAAVRWFARRLADVAADLGVVDDQVVRQAERVASIEDVGGSRPIRGRHISQGELAALLDACYLDPTPAGARDAALIANAWSVGARRDELGSLTMNDYIPTSETEGDLVIHGKGDKVRTLYVYNGAFDALADWLAIRGSDPGWLFCTITKGGKLTHGRLYGEPLRKMLNKRIAEAKVKPLTWHDFRRTFAGNLLDQGVDLVTVQKLMGHSSPTTTSNYDRRGDEIKRAAIKKLFVPYRRRGIK